MPEFWDVNCDLWGAEVWTQVTIVMTSDSTEENQKLHFDLKNNGSWLNVDLSLPCSEAKEIHLIPFIKFLWSLHYMHYMSLDRYEHKLRVDRLDTYGLVAIVQVLRYDLLRTLNLKFRACYLILDFTLHLKLNLTKTWSHLCRAWTRNKSAHRTCPNWWSPGILRALLCSVHPGFRDDSKLYVFPVYTQTFIYTNT